MICKNSFSIFSASSWPPEAAVTRLSGVTEMRLLTMGTPISAEMALPTLTRLPAFFIILS